MEKNFPLVKLTYGKEFSFGPQNVPNLNFSRGHPQTTEKNFPWGIHNFIGIFHTVVIILNLISINVNGTFFIFFSEFGAIKDISTKKAANLKALEYSSIRINYSSFHFFHYSRNQLNI